MIEEVVQESGRDGTVEVVVEVVVEVEVEGGGEQERCRNTPQSSVHMVYMNETGERR